jgi:hypothetical protein
MRRPYETSRRPYAILRRQTYRQIFPPVPVWVRNDAGRVAKPCWFDIPIHLPHGALDAFGVMPNHVHGILVITDVAYAVGAKNFSPLPSLPFHPPQQKHRVAPTKCGVAPTKKPDRCALDDVVYDVLDLTSWVWDAVVVLMRAGRENAQHVSQDHNRR